MSKELSRIYLERIEAMLRNALGRDLTSDERKYLGLSAIAARPGGDDSLFGSPDPDGTGNSSTPD